MRNFATITKLSILTGVMLLAGCALSQQQSAERIDLSQLKAMHFQFHDDSGWFDAVDTKLIEQGVSSHLGQWGYVFSNIDYSHLLMLNVGQQQYGTTPIGFSFSSGNSNPRALDFQKAQTLPMTCAISSKTQPEKHAELTLEVMVDNYLNLSKEKITDELINDASTACFNLLTGLKIKTKAAVNKTQSTIPTWIPEIRMEVEQTPESTSTTEKNTSTPIIKKPPRKRIVIHNQGNPVIFKFGYERK